jgi:exopolyphosphatase/guanosine-5'-triphosphate,3'-diphosphate pyrophosphatase
MSSDFVAAIDLGSNSFHMVVARITDGHVQILDRLREMVQLAAGLDDNNRLSPQAQQRALDCLARFAQRLRHIPPARVRIVGTNTLRQARNSAEFVARAEQTLAHRVEVVSGHEEARLIYLGVAQSVGHVAGQRLVIDIGGGSTELIIGEAFDPLHLASLRMGCVSISRACFADGRVTAGRLRQAELLVQLHLEPVREEYLARGWEMATGASGSIKAIQDVIVREGWSREGITLDALRRLRAALLETSDPAGLVSRWQLEPPRARVFAGGFVVLHGLCETLGIERLEVSEGALREGLIYDLLGRIRHEDVRDRTIADVIRRFTLDQAQAERVSATALELLRQVRARWGLAGKEARRARTGRPSARDRPPAVARPVPQARRLCPPARRSAGLLARRPASAVGPRRRHRRSFPADAFAALPKAWVRSARRACTCCVWRWCCIVAAAASRCRRSSCRSIGSACTAFPRLVGQRIP